MTSLRLLVSRARPNTGVTAWLDYRHPAGSRIRDVTAVSILFGLMIVLATSVAAPRVVPVLDVSEVAVAAAPKLALPAPPVPALEEPVAAATPPAADPPAAAPAPPVETAAPKAVEPGTKTAAAPTTTVAPPPPPPDPVALLPTGKGMWIWKPERADGGDPAAIIARARASGISHIFVRTGSTKSGFHGGPFLDVVLPAAHEAGLKVYGWDFPYFYDIGDDVNRALTAITYEVNGHRIDGFVADIETRHEGTRLTVAAAQTYSQALRESVDRAFPLVAAIPRPSDYTKTFFPYAQVAQHFTAVAPMVYWLNRQPDTDVAGAVDWLSQFGKPVLPIGQAYDGAPEGGRPGVPPPDEIRRFISAAAAHGAHSVSFWSWQHANQGVWDAIRDAPEFASG